MTPPDPVPEMVERVARAMYEKSMDSCGIEGGIRTYSEANRGQSWADLSWGIRVVLFENARAAIEAMREPTLLMVDRGDDANANAECDRESTARIYRAMIYAALKPREEK